MSDPLRVALVVEGPTDRIVIEAAVSRILGERSYILKQLQPEESVAFGPLGTGWAGVYYWCRQSVGRAGGCLRNDPLFVTYDLLLLHLDAAVAAQRYADANIADICQDLPCARRCPPPADTTDPLRGVLLRWAGEAQTPPQTVLCTPSKSIEAWVLAALFPHDASVRGGNLECLQSPENRLSQQPIRTRIRKTVRDYRARFSDMQDAWPSVTAICSEAKRFNDEFVAVVPPVQ